MAILKAKYETKEEVPVEYKELFEQKGETAKGANDGKWILTNIEGIQTEANVLRLTTALTKVRKENAEYKEKLAIHTKTPEEIVLLEEELVESKLLADSKGKDGKPDESKINELVEVRLKQKLGPLERELAATKTKLTEGDAANQKLTGVITTGKISKALREAAGNGKVKPSAVEDFIELSSRCFEVVDLEGVEKVMTKEGVGVTPGINAVDYLAEVAPKKTWLFETSQGAGSQGGGRGAGGQNGNNPWSKEFWSMTEQGAFVKLHGKEKGDKLAAQAGSRIGATGPPAK